MKRRITILAAILWLSLYSPLSAQESWQTDIKVSVLDAQNRLSIGQKLDATDGWNARYDVPAILFGDITAYLEEPEGRKYWRKLRSPCDAYPCVRTWDVSVESDLEDQIIRLNWNFSSLPSGMKVRLIDKVTDDVIDMQAQAEYSYKNIGKRRFQMEVQW